MVLQKGSSLFQSNGLVLNLEAFLFSESIIEGLGISKLG